jgi:hypothetical protein
MASHMSKLVPRILILYPHASIDTNPTMAFLLESLAERKIPTSVLLANGSGFLPPTPFGKTVRLEHVSEQYFVPPWPSLRELPKRIVQNVFSSGPPPSFSLRTDPAAFGLWRAWGYSIVVGVDPGGIILANYLNRWSKRPLAYISFEVVLKADVTSNEERLLHALERRAREQTSLLLIQDEERAELFSRETPFPSDKVIMVPVAPSPQKVVKTDFLHKMLGIPAKKRIVLYCGNFCVWASPEEISEMVSYWPEEYCLVIHNRAHQDTNTDGAIFELPNKDRIFFSTSPVTREDLPTLVASADFGLAPYKPLECNWMTRSNLQHLGLASGKVSYYALCGLPILARTLPVFHREFQAYQCGKIYERVAETGSMLVEMDKNYSHYSDEALRFYQERLNPTQGMRRFCDALTSLAEKSVPLELL